ncbi:MAG: DegV family protein [Chloroflexota bacterium]|nr:DegV family protein [Chloroflexota bacterium]
MSNQKVAVVTDSSAYISRESLGDLNIPIIPLWVIWGDERFRDGVDIAPATFYHRLREAERLPSTSQPSAGEFVEFFRRVAAESDTDTIVGIYISTGISGTVASAEAAKAQLPELNITNIDSLSTSMGLGFIAMEAARAAVAGGSLEEVVAVAEGVRQRANIIFVVDTLEYLHKGGRIGGASRFLGTALNIKPLLHLENGRIEALEQVRTKRKALARLLSVAAERAGTAPVGGVSVVDAGAIEVGDIFARQVQERFGVSQIDRTSISPVIGTHTGPGTVGIAFYTER